MANGWAQYAQYLDALSKKQNPAYSPVTPAVTQADMGEVADAPVAAPPQPMPQRAPAAKKMPLRAVASPVAASTFGDRLPTGDLEAIKALWDRQQGDVEKTRAQADTLEATPPKSDLSWLAGLTSAWGGDEGKAIASKYEKPVSPEERVKMVAQLRNLADDNEKGLTGQRVQLALGGDKNDMSVIKALLAGQTRGVASDEKENKEFSKQEKVMREALFFQGRTAPEIRSSIGKLQRATQAIALMESIPNGTPNPGEMSNIATAMAGLATNGNIITNEKLKEILPKNVELTKAGIFQFLTSKPHGAQQKEFLDRFRREIDQETRVARGTLIGYQQDQADAMQGLTRSDRHKQIFDAAQNFINNRYYNPDTKKASADQAVGELPASWDEAKKKKYLELKAKAAAK